MSKILVTGGSGLVGRYLKQIMPNAYYISSDDYDLTKENEVELLFKKNRFKTVIHLAAKVGGIHHNIIEPVKYFEENILMNTLILKYSYKNKVKYFLTLLSSCIYPDRIKKFPIKEKNLFEGSPHKSLFSYSYAKRCMAVHIDAYNKKFKTNYNYIIPCNLYGDYDKFEEIEGHFVGALIKKILIAKKKKKKIIKLFGDGSPKRQFMHAKDLAKIIFLLNKKNIFKSFNVATDENYSIKKIAKIALKACDFEEAKIYFDKKMPNGQLRKDVDITNFKKIFPNYKPIKLYDGIKEVYSNQKKKFNYE
jgi:GDP-L-fucose synthase